MSTRTWRRWMTWCSERDAALPAGHECAFRVDLILSTLEILPLEVPADRHYGDIRQRLARLGTPIGPNVLLIAAQARSLDLTVVTANEREFARVPGLRVENWA